MAHGREVKHKELRGLDKEDAYELAVQLFKDLDIPQSRAPYRELRDLLEQLDHHPLAIQLVLPVLGEAGMTIDRIITEFATLLPRFTDDRESGRNRSLLASLEYSLRRLSDEQRQLLARLAVFEGGASEDDLLAITEITKADWLDLRPALERATLITPKKVGDFSAPFLHFHPVLSPFLRSQLVGQNERLQSRFVSRYRAIAEYLYHEDSRSQLPVRELVRYEMPNIKHSLNLLLNDGSLDTATDLLTFAAYFLNMFGLWRECDEIRQQLSDAITNKDDKPSDVLTHAEFIREVSLGEDKLYRGALRAAIGHITKVLERVLSQSADARYGQESYEHCVTLNLLARCLSREGKLGDALSKLREAMSICDVLITGEPDDQMLIRNRYMTLGELGNVLLSQGNYEEALVAYESSLKEAIQYNDSRTQAVTIGQLGTLALHQRFYARARELYLQAVHIFRVLGEPIGESIYLHQLGMLAYEQKEWAEAERYCRESLAIKERHGDMAGAVSTYNELALIAEDSARSDEAESWLRRALQVPGLPTPGEALFRNNLSDLLKKGVRAGRWPKERLAEARIYAEEALAMMKDIGESSEIWLPLKNLADIYEMEGNTEQAHVYRRREHEAYAAFAGNRHNINDDFSEFLSDIPTASQGGEPAKMAIREFLPKLEAKGWRVTSAIHRIFAGERDWHSLAEDLNRVEALLVKRVLETIEEMEKE